MRGAGNLKMSLFNYKITITFLCGVVNVLIFVAQYIKYPLMTQMAVGFPYSEYKNTWRNNKELQ